ncbi:cytochrome C [bacterium]|nr:cytochrome C [bacterium]
MTDPTDRPSTTDADESTSRFQAWFKARLPIFWDNGIAAAGSVIGVVTLALLGLMLLLFVANTITGRDSNPYVDLVGFLVLPAILAFAVVLLVIGNVVRRRRERTEGRSHTVLDITSGRFVRRAVTVVGICLVAFVGLGMFSFEAYHYTDSNQFCSTVCHEVMEPEATTHATSPHANVKCVECHIGPGASWFVRAKLSGLRQVYAVLTDDFHRPIPTPVLNLRPARETCEVCHWPTQFHGSHLVAHPRFAGDRENTEQTTALVVHVGGPEGAAETTESSGIHWHVDPRNEVRYRHLDRKRQEIVEVVQTTPDGEVRYQLADAPADSGEWRTMDCLDCHNRPTHIYHLPHRAMDMALSTGTLDADVPWLRKEGERVLREVTPTDDTAAAIAVRLREIYREEHPDDLAALEAAIEPTSRALADILERNVWPGMNIDWGTYESNLSHFDAVGEFGDGGCFRCHNEMLESDEGDVISQDCEACHALVAMEETDWDGIAGIDAAAFRP